MKGETNGSSVLPWCSVGEQAAILHMAGVVQVRPVALCCLYSTSSLLYYQIKAKMSKEYLKRRRRRGKKKKQSRPHIKFSLLSKVEKKKKWKTQNHIIPELWSSRVSLWKSGVNVLIGSPTDTTKGNPITTRH